MIAPTLSVEELNRIVVDTNVMVSGMLGGTGASRTILRLCLDRQYQPLMGEKLFHEYSDLAGRRSLDRSPLNRGERQELIEAFFSVCEWVSISYLWRPNLPDEGDNHVIELAIAGTAESIVTSNARDFVRGELKFTGLHIETPAEFLKRRRSTYGDHDHPNP